MNKESKSSHISIKYGFRTIILCTWNCNFYFKQFRSAAEIERLKYELTKLQEATAKPG